MTELINNFTTTYLYQEYEEEFEDFDGALAAFLEDQGQGDRNAFLVELRGLADAHRTEETMLAALEELDWDDLSETGSALDIVAYAIALTEAFIAES